MDGGFIGFWFFDIVTAAHADETERHAANELRKFIYQCTGASPRIFSALTRCPEQAHEIRVGRNVRPSAFYDTINNKILGNEGFAIKTHGDHLYITGATSRGTIYGVYTFLERFLGCRWFTPEVSRTPKRQSLVLSCIDIVEIPAFEYRDAYWGCAFEGNFCARNKLNGTKALIAEEMGGKMHFYNFHHSFNDLVPPELFFADHPEYYSEIDGVRTSDHAQLCLTNHEVFEIALGTLRCWIRENPNCNIFSISQNDGYGYCTCDHCRAIDEAEGSPSATIISFANKLATAIENEYPHILLHTFAYVYSTVPPKTIRPHRNVIVRICSFRCDYAKAFAETAFGDPTGGTAEFVNALKVWSKVSDRLYVWDYCTNFLHYLLPFPNLDSLQQNIRLYRDNKVKGVFMEGNFSQGCGGGMAELQAYIQARLMWHPDVDLWAEIDDFLSGVYGNGAPYIKRYLELLQNAVKGHRLGIYDSPDAPYFTNALVEAADELFRAADHAAENERVRERIQKEYLSVEYLQLTRLPVDAHNRKQRMDAFASHVRSFEISELSERRYLEESLANIRLSQYARDIRKESFCMYYRM